MKRCTGIFLLLGWMVAMNAQPLQQKVSLNYTNEPLGYVLDAISANYRVNFSYSSNFVPVQQKVTVSVVNQPLSIALDNMLKETAVDYVEVGQQVVLRTDKHKKAQLSQLQTLPGKVRQTSPIYPERNTSPNGRRNREVREVPAIEGQRIASVPGGNSVLTMHDASLRSLVQPISQTETSADETSRRLAQISLLPFLNSEANRKRNMTNTLSLNLLWGDNGGVEGLEVGGFVNRIRNDVKGVQVAGFANLVDNDVSGTQLSGLFNINHGKLVGVQAAGVFNHSGDAKAIQAAGVYNIARGDVKGVQVAGVFNMAQGYVDGVQASVLFNLASDKAKTQTAGLFNIAGDVEWGQMALLFNKGKKVEGFQFALVNIADTICGTPFGFLNLVKKGYNRFEIAGGETMYGNLSAKLGTHKFYNIFQLAARWDDDYKNGESKLSWALGYGLGTAIRLHPRSLLNFEVVTMHVNEREVWTRELHLLNQVRATFDWQIGKKTSCFAGPVLNIMVSKKVDAESGVYGSQLTPRPFYESTSDTGNNLKMWVGLTAGLRM
ncbi:MAG: STN domain-containing protein [Saprospiraceae bacterium]|nr:STN domain-containing protein [Saprospiraceae bacterium]